MIRVILQVAAIVGAVFFFQAWLQVFGTSSNLLTTVGGLLAIGAYLGVLWVRALVAPVRRGAAGDSSALPGPDEED